MDVIKECDILFFIKMFMKVRVVLFIIKSGWIGKNKLVDMEKEN